MRATSIISEHKSKPFRMSLVISYFLLAAVTIAAYLEVIIWLIKGWFTFKNSYSVLILVFSIYMIYNKLSVLRCSPVKPNLLVGGSITLFSCAVLIAGKLSNTLMLQGISLVVTLLGLVFLLFGNRWFRILWLPIGYLFFMFYLFEELLGNFSVHLQNLAALIAAHLLRWTGMPVVLSGHLIELPHITLEVAKVCNGINHLVALVALSIPIVATSSLSRLNKIGIVSLAFVAGLLTNGMRVMMIGLWSKYHPNSALHGPFDIFYVSFVLFIGLMIISIVVFLSHRTDRNTNPIKDVPSSAAPSAQFSGFPSTRLPILIGILIFGLVNGYIYLNSPKQIDLTRPLSSFPKQIGKWAGETVHRPEWPVKNINADHELKRIYSIETGKLQLGLYIGYFRDQHQSKELVNSQLAWLHLREERIPVAFADQTHIIGRGKARGMDEHSFKGDNRIFYFWYVVDNLPRVDRRLVKMQLLLNNLLQRRSNGALVIVSIEKDSRVISADDDAASLDFIRQAFPQIRSFLPFA